MTELYRRESPDRREEVVVSKAGNLERQHRVVEDVAAERREAAFKLSQFIWLIFGGIIGLIGLRVILRLIAADPANPFANMVYNLTDLFLWPFFGLTGTPSAGGMVLEVPSIIAMFVYALLAWFIVTLVRLILYRSTSQVVETYERDHR